MELINLPLLNDQQLVIQAIQGEKKAFDTLFLRYRSPVYHFICKRSGNGADALDLTMEAFGKAFRKLNTFVPDHAFSTWLFKIAHNHCIDFARRRKLSLANKTAQELPALANLADGSLNAEEAMVRQERMAMVVAALRQLNPRYRQMIELRYYEEMSYEEIAAKLQLPLGTVKAQLFRAKEMMRSKSMRYAFYR